MRYRMKAGGAEISETHSRKNNEIEILRGISVILVMLAHVPVIFQWERNHWLPFFLHQDYWFGVDIFFAISGFVVTKSVAKSFTNATATTMPKTVLAFLVRRFYRLTPIAWLVLLASIIAAIFFNTTGIYGTPSGNIADAVSFVLYSANWHAAQCASKATTLCGMNQLYWSLSLEEQFYLVLPFALFLLKKKVWILAAVLIVVQFPIERPLFQTLWLFRVDAICWGVLIAFASETEAYRQFAPLKFRSFPVRSFFLAVVLACMSFFAKGSIPLGVGLIGIGSAALVWAASYDEGYLFQRASKMTVLLWIGSRSYGLYLLHPICFFVMLDIGIRQYGAVANIPHSYTVPCLIGGLVITGVLCELSFRFIETPLRHRGRRIAQRIMSDPPLIVATTQAAE